MVATTASFVSEASLSFTLLLTKVLNSGLLHLAADFFAAIKGYSLAIAGYGHLEVLLNHEEKQYLGSTYSSEETELVQAVILMKCLIYQHLGRVVACEVAGERRWVAAEREQPPASAGGSWPSRG